MVNGYGNLKREIVDPDLCTLCGACESACPVNAIGITADRNHHLFDCSENFDSCSICHEVCPHTSPNLEEAFKELSSAPYSLPGIGRFTSIKTARSNFEDIRHITRSGGVAAALSVCGTETGMVDAAVSSEAKNLDDMPTPLKFKIPMVTDYLPSMLKVEFHPAAVAKAYDSVVKGYAQARVAFIGLPCHMTALRKLQLFGHKSSEQLGFLISRFCLWNPQSIRNFSSLLSAKGIQLDAVDEINLDDSIKVKSDINVHDIPLSELWGNIREGCKTCMDFTGAFSDISVGRVEGISKDWSILIVRTKQGEELVNRAEREGYLESANLPHAVEEEIQAIAGRKKALAKQEVYEVKRGILAPSAFEIMERCIP